MYSCMSMSPLMCQSKADFKTRIVLPARLLCLFCQLKPLHNSLCQGRQWTDGWFGSVRAELSKAKTQRDSTLLHHDEGVSSLEGG